MVDVMTMLTVARMTVSQRSRGISRVSLSKPSPSLLVHDLFPNMTCSRIFNMCNVTPFKNNSVADRI